ncbi:hypothetical protein GDO81_004695 [Engystomops pustulosus]|uniref:Secreted protein n=1 Tax=Engystomops pustulosus TaxID=76066 RepID=A0AAV7CI37_ENGPU|nr:hypothetical protein GDO81_004695 [Engystomops pustulosus]
MFRPQMFSAFISYSAMFIVRTYKLHGCQWLSLYLFNFKDLMCASPEAVSRAAHCGSLSVFVFHVLCSLSQFECYLLQFYLSYHQA